MTNSVSNERLNRIEGQQEANSRAIADLAEQLRTSSQEHDRRMAEHDQRMAEIAAQQKANTQAIARIPEQQEANMQAIAGIAEQLTISGQEHDRRMADHNLRMADHDRRLAEIDQRLARLTQLTERFFDQTLSYEERIAALERM